MAQIRNKRLAKLQAPSRTGESVGDSSNSITAPKATNQPSDGPSQEQSSSKINITSPGASAVSLPTLQNSFSQSGTGKSDTEKEGLAAPGVPIKRADVSPASGIRAKSPPGRGANQKESIEAWEDKTLSGIFRITLHPGITRDAHGQTLYYARSVREELEEQKEAVRLSIGMLEQAILEVASSLGSTPPLDFLLACWKRVSRLCRGMKIGKAEDAKNKILKEARRLCMSYCIFAITMPEVFGYVREPQVGLYCELTA